VATILIASSGISSIVEITSEKPGRYMALPILAAAIGMAGSLIALLTRRSLPVGRCVGVQSKSSGRRRADPRGVFLAVNAMEVDIGVFYAFVLGVVTGLVSGLLTEWYTSGPPVRRIAQASGMGSVTTLLAGSPWNAVNRASAPDCLGSGPDRLQLCRDLRYRDRCGWDADGDCRACHYRGVRPIIESASAI